MLHPESSCSMTVQRRDPDYADRIDPRPHAGSEGLPLPPAVTGAGLVAPVSLTLGGFTDLDGADNSGRSAGREPTHA
jgi:hypothetical protein